MQEQQVFSSILMATWRLRKALTNRSHQFSMVDMSFYLCSAVLLGPGQRLSCFTGGQIIVGFIIGSFHPFASVNWPSEYSQTDRFRSLLIAAAISMGAVAIWSMHFVVDYAICVRGGDELLHLKYSSGSTIGSLFLPIGIAAASFYLFGDPRINIWIRIPLGGVTMSAAICSMHYFTQAGVLNYACSTSNGYTISAIFFAVTASSIALGTSFTLTSIWRSTWFKRLACASLLAVCSSGTHWIATLGTSYHLTATSIVASAGISGNVTVLVALCLVSPAENEPVPYSDN